MPRDGEAVHVRLQQAALELFGERGYDQTTAAEIAARAGVTERTFFRHFADKRETLFGGEAKLRVALLEALREVPSDLGPLPTLLATFRAVVPLLEANRPFSEPRQKVIDANPALREREIAKVASLNRSLASELERRGTGPRRADLAAQAGMAAFAHAVAAWLADPAQPLSDQIAGAFDDLYALVSPCSGSDDHARQEDESSRGPSQPGA